MRPTRNQNGVISDDQAFLQYCGADCQKTHWALHKIDCKSFLGKETWQPDWALEHRTPAFVRGGIGVHFGTKKFPWGNIPALDVLQLDSNEGSDYEGELHLLFAGAYLVSVTSIPLRDY